MRIAKPSSLIAFIFFAFAAAPVTFGGEPVVLKPLPQAVFMEDSTWSLSLQEYFADPDGKPLSFAASSPEDSLAAMALDSTLVLSPSPDWSGGFSVVLLVTSESGHALSRILQGRVTAVNDPPRGTAALAKAILLAEDSVKEVDGAIYLFDPDGRIVSVTGDPGEVSIELVASRLRIRARQDWHGTKGVGLQVTDDSGAATRCTLHVLVTPVNDAPFLSGMPADGAIQANGSFTVDFSGLARDVDDSLAGLVAEAAPLQGVRFRSAGLRLTVLPFARLDTVTVTGVVADTGGGTAPFRFRLFCNQGFKDNSLHLLPNLPTNRRTEPVVLMNADGSFDAVTMADSAVFLNRYRPDGSQKEPGRALRLNVRDTVSMISIKRDGGKYFVQTYANRFGLFEIRALDTDFRETAKLDPPAHTGTLELDTARKRVLLVSSQTVGGNPEGTLTLYDYDLTKGASKRFHVSTPRPDSSPARAGQPHTPYIGEVSLAVLPDRYALLWGTSLRGSRFYRGVQYAALSPDLLQSDSARELDAYVDDRPDSPLNDIEYFRAYSHWGHVYCVWQLRETSWSSIGSYSEGPTLRIWRLDAALKPASPIRRLSSGKPWYLLFGAPEFLAEEIIVPWNTSDSYPATPREYYAVHFRPELDSGRSEPVAKDTLNFPPRRHLLDGKVHLLSRMTPQGQVVASLADGRIPASLARDAREPGRRPAGRMIRPGPEKHRRFDALGRTKARARKSQK